VSRTVVVTVSREGWPPALAVRDDGVGLVLDGCDLDELAREHGTPLWAISRATLEANFTGLRDAFARRYPRFEVAYSM
jgi:diaminopimelate decarboxylase